MRVDRAAYYIKCDECLAEFPHPDGYGPLVFLYDGSRGDTTVVDDDEDLFLSDSDWRIEGDRHICPDCGWDPDEDDEDDEE